MSPSSSGSWPSGPGDIIDLDRYMRGNVRPSRALSAHNKQIEEFIVDSGGCKPRSDASGDARYKHASLDSGVSDGSYRRTRRAHTKHRRGSYHEEPSFYPPHETALTKTLSGRANSTNSMREFRTVCEKALLQQQQQIARVAELCERLTERAEKTEKTERNERSESLPQFEQNKRDERVERLSNQNERVKRKAPSESSDLSSSSRSTKDPKRKDTHRTQECKTYKIIMSKLDELNRLFATRPPRPARPARLVRSPSSSSVSVCDKLVATEPQRTYNRVLAPTQQRVRCASAAGVSLTSAARSSRHESARTVTQAFAVDIAPRDTRPVRNNVITESIVKCESSGESDQSACDPRCGFDLEDPVHLYSQAKRLQPASVRTRRTRSVETSRAPWVEAHHAHARDRCGDRPRAPSLCALCRGYWRYLRQCVPALARALDNYKCS